MTDEEAKSAILTTITSRPVTVDEVQGAANTVLADDAQRLISFTKWMVRNGEKFCAALNKTAPAGPPG